MGLVETLRSTVMTMGIHDMAGAILILAVLLDEWQRFRERLRESNND